MIDVEALKNRLREVEMISDQQWLDSLSERKRKELEFHDADRDTSRIESLDKDTYEKLYGNRKYYQATGLSSAYVDNWIREHVKDKVFCTMRVVIEEM